MTMLPLSTWDVAPLSSQSLQRTRHPVRRGREIVSEPELIAERCCCLCYSVVSILSSSVRAAALDVEFIEEEVWSKQQAAWHLPRSFDNQESIALRSAEIRRSF